MSAVTDTTALAVIWHDVECGGYSGDLELWAELAALSPEQPVLEIGCGTGRVALDLAARGHHVLGVDRVPSLLSATRDRAARRGLDSLSAMSADALTLNLDQRFGLILMPMQVLQLFADSTERGVVLSAARGHLMAGGRVAVAVVEGMPLDGQIGSEYEPPLPDVTEIDGWVYSSLPLEVSSAGDRMVVTRLRQVVTPDGDLSEEIDHTTLAILSREQVPSEARDAGLEVVGHRVIDDSLDHVGSTVILMEAR